jgi:hypothetical protein
MCKSKIETSFWHIGLSAIRAILSNEIDLCELSLVMLASELSYELTQSE